MALTVEEIKQFETLRTSEVSDAMENLQMRRSVIHGMRMVAPQGTVVVGSAVTVAQAPKHYPTPHAEKVVKHQQTVSTIAKEGDVMVIDVGGRMDVGTWGDRHTQRAVNRGVRGLLVNGCVRDIDAIREIGLPVFCLGLSPISSHWDLESISVNQPISIGGVQIRPGDIIFGDETGVIVIPLEAKTIVLEAALAALKFEDAKGPPV